MGHVVAFIDQDTCKVFHGPEDAPPGSVIFSSPEELGKALQKQSMDSIRGRLLGMAVDPSETRAIAAVRLWHVLSVGADACALKMRWGKDYPGTVDSFGNRRSGHHLKFELIQLTWVPGRDHMADHFYKTLAPQSRQILNMLVDDGRGIWTKDQVHEVILSRRGELTSCQNPLYLFKYYSRDYFPKHLLKKVSYADFASSPEFSGKSLSLEVAPTGVEESSVEQDQAS
jgi:hypothetical protein